MPQAVCPSHAELVAFTRGELPGAELESIGAHMEGCSTCDLAAQALEDIPDPVADVLRREDQETARLGPVASRASVVRPLSIRWLGGFEVMEELGRGGMGVVYKGWDADLKRYVALKVIRSGQHADKSEAVRFRREAEAVARVHHPGLVQIYDIGQDQGLPFLALEYVAGGTLERHLDDGPLPIDSVARLISALADAVQAAHDAGVVHRDLKPGNVLLSTPPVGGVWSVKIADFGLAKYLDGTPALSATEQVAGTPSYMSPEQAGGRGKEIGPATDVYALGAILYEALVGHPPFRGESSADTLSQVMHTEPVAPSRLRPRVPRDLETICLKCLKKEPRQRYASARELAEDLERFLANKPVRARRAGVIERSVRLCLRNPLPAALIALVATSLVGGTAIASHFAVLAGRREADARTSESDAIRGKSEADAARDELRQHLYFAQMHLAGHAAELHRPWLQIAAHIEPWRDAKGPVRPGWEWHYLDSLGRRDIARLPLQTPPNDLIWNPTGTQVAILDRIGGGEIRNVPPATQHEITLAPDSTAFCAAWSPDGKRLATGVTNCVRIWRVEDGSLLQSFPTLAGVLAVNWSQDGQRVAAFTSGTSSVQIWNLDTGASLPGIPLPANRGHQYAMNADWTRVAVVSIGRIDLFDPAGVRPPIAIEEPTAVLKWSLDGRRLAIGQASKYRIAVIDADTGRTATILHGHRARVAALDWSPDGKFLTSASADSLVHVWDVGDGSLVDTLLGHSGPLQAVAWSPVGGRILSAGFDGEARLWRARPPITALSDRAAEMSWSRDSTQLAVIDHGGRLHVVARDGLRAVSPRDGYPTSATSIAWSPGSHMVACGGQDGVVTLLNPATGETLFKLGEPTTAISALAWNRSGDRIAAAYKGGTVNIWDVKERRISRNLANETGLNVRMLAWGADDSLAAAVDAEAWLWKGNGEKRIFTPPLSRPNNQVTHVTWSGDGSQLAVGDWLGRVFVLPRGSVEPSRKFSAGEGVSVSGLSWSPDGRRLTAAAFGQGVQLWDTATGASAFSLEVDGGLSDLAWSPDGTALAGVAQVMGRIVLWDPTPGVLLPHRAASSANETR